MEAQLRRYLRDLAVAVKMGEPAPEVQILGKGRILAYYMFWSP